MKLFFAFGTRPEAIKMAPLIHEALKQKHEVIVALSGQHKEMVAPFIEFFELKVDHDLEIMKPNQTLTDITVNALTGYSRLIAEAKPDVVLVQGDTTTSFVAGLAAFYNGCKVAHVEAGLRTFNRTSPFPEEVNRSLLGRIADFHFPPTVASAENLKSENITENLWVTGNTSIDALEYTLKKIADSPELQDQIQDSLPRLDPDKRTILVTTHRRENLGDGHREIFRAIKEMIERYPDIEIVFPVHLNPKVQDLVREELGKTSRVHLTAPLDYLSFVWMMNRSFLILTESGGVQEEAPHLGKPVIVLRETTERPEAIDAGCSFLVGTSKEKILKKAYELLDNPDYYKKVSKIANPFGDGHASEKIIEALRDSTLKP